MLSKSIGNVSQSHANTGLLRPDIPGARPIDHVHATAVFRMQVLLRHGHVVLRAHFACGATVRALLAGAALRCRPEDGQNRQKDRRMESDKGGQGRHAGAHNADCSFDDPGRD